MYLTRIGKDDGSLFSRLWHIYFSSYLIGILSWNNQNYSSYLDNHLANNNGWIIYGTKYSVLSKLCSYESLSTTKLEYINVTVTISAIPSQLRRTWTTGKVSCIFSYVSIITSWGQKKVEIILFGSDINANVPAKIITHWHFSLQGCFVQHDFVHYMYSSYINHSCNLGVINWSYELTIRQMDPEDKHFRLTMFYLYSMDDMSKHQGSLHRILQSNHRHKYSEHSHWWIPNK